MNLKDKALKFSYCYFTKYMAFSNLHGTLKQSEVQTHFELVTGGGVNWSQSMFYDQF